MIEQLDLLPGADGDDLDLVDLDELPDPQPGVTDVELKGCRWISGEPAPLCRGMFCGKPTRPGSAWCAEHHMAAFGKVGRRKRDAA